MVAVFGEVGKFDVAKEEWPQYDERLGHFFEANGIEDEGKKRSIFHMVVGPTVFKLIRNLVPPAKPGEKSYEDLVKLLTEHYKPTLSERVQWFKFHIRSWKPGESVANFEGKLYVLAEFCNFGASLEAMLWDQIVRGINDSAIQGRLLAEAPCHLRRPYSWLREWRQLFAMSRSYRGVHLPPPEGEKSDTSAKGKPAKAMAQFQGSQTAHVSGVAVWITWHPGADSRMLRVIIVRRRVTCRLCAMGKQRDQPRSHRQPNPCSMCRNRRRQRSIHCFTCDLWIRAPLTMWW